MGYYIIKTINDGYNKIVLFIQTIIDNSRQVIF